MQQIRHAQLLHQGGTVVGGGAVHAETDRNAELQHFRNACDTGGELHVGNGAVTHAGARLGEHAQLFIVEVDAVGVPDVAAGPAETLHILERTNALAREHEVFLILRLTQVGVQAHAVLAGKHGALAQKIGADRERGAGGKRNAVHGAVRGVVILLDELGGILHDLVDRLHHAVGRQTAVLDGKVHAAAGGVHADAQLIGRSELSADQIAGMGGENIVMVKAGRAAVLHQLTHAGEGGKTDDVGVEVLPDLIERSEPVKQLHILYLGKIAGKDLIKMVVRVDKTGVAKHVFGMDDPIRLAVESGADLPDEAVFGVEVNVLVDLVVVVAGNEGTDILQQ